MFISRILSRIPKTIGGSSNKFASTNATKTVPELKKMEEESASSEPCKFSTEELSERIRRVIREEFARQGSVRGNAGGGDGGMGSGIGGSGSEGLVKKAVE